MIAPPEEDRECLPYSREVLQRSYDVLPQNALLREAELQSLIDRVYPQIKRINIGLDAVFVDGKWRLNESDTSTGNSTYCTFSRPPNI